MENFGLLVLYMSLQLSWTDAFLIIFIYWLIVEVVWVLDWTCTITLCPIMLGWTLHFTSWILIWWWIFTFSLLTVVISWNFHRINYPGTLFLWWTFGWVLLIHVQLYWFTERTLDFHHVVITACFLIWLCLLLLFNHIFLNCILIMRDLKFLFFLYLTLIIRLYLV